MTTTRDPDRISECYSDHAHDIQVKGVCDFCGSTDPLVIGHILPDVPRVKGVDPVEAAQLVVTSKSLRMVDGVLLDMLTASAIIAVYEALSPDGQAKLRRMSLPKAGSVALSLTSRRRS